MKTNSNFQKTLLKSGIRVVTENHPSARAAVAGVWSDVGTRYESPDDSGVSHLIEHLLFKRTKNRTAFQIAKEMEAVGGDINAFTGREHTCFHTHSLSEHLSLSLDLLSDVFCRPAFDLSDLEKEKQVVIQEIRMSEEQVEESIFDRFLTLAYRGSSLSLPILGTVESIETMRKKQILDYYLTHYGPKQTIVAVAGRVDHHQVVDLVEEKFVWSKKRQARGDDHFQRAKLKGFREYVGRPSEQVHILLGLPASHFKSRLRFEAFVANSLLGGGMTSRLYQGIRERRGLAYSVYSTLMSFLDTGLSLIYAGTDPEKVEKVLELIVKEVHRLQANGISKRELDFFKTQVRGQILLGSDDLENRMNSLGVNELVFGRYRPIEEVMGEIEKVSVDSVREYLDSLWKPSQFGLLLMGPEEYRDRNWLSMF